MINENVARLFHEAGGHIRTVNGATWSYTDEGFDYEKFAELIILECNMALSPHLRDMISRGQACDLINNHFGVEE